MRLFSTYIIWYQTCMGFVMHQNLYKRVCINDATIRDWQRHTSQFTPGKNYPSTGGFGPMMVTNDEVGDYKKLNIQTRLNGKMMQDSKLSQLIFTIPELINYISTFTPLSPGDVIVSGTPGGVGDRRDPPIYM